MRVLHVSFYVGFGRTRCFVPGFHVVAVFVLWLAIIIQFYFCLLFFVLSTHY
jgi:hypothetical protein